MIAIRLVGDVPTVVEKKDGSFEPISATRWKEILGAADLPEDTIVPVMSATIEQIERYQKEPDSLGAGTLADHEGEQYVPGGK